MKSNPKIIVSGMIAGNPGQGGATWAVLQYVLGFLRLHYDVYLVEPISRDDLLPASSPLESSQNAVYFLDVVRDFGLAGRSSLILRGTTQTVGLSYSQVRGVAREASLLVNVSGMLDDTTLIEGIPCRVYLDLDPAFNQLWHATQGIDMRLEAHNCFVTVGNNLGNPMCSVPECGVSWITTLQPVVLGWWPTADTILYDGFTTIANWRGYGSIDHNGVFYGQKAHSLRGFMDLPKRSSEKFMLALAIHADERRDLDALTKNGWLLMDPAELVRTPQQYQRFISGSKAEFGIAKSGYVVSRCGWFSDRSACYLASGRPVLAQDTGFGSYLPCGEGLFRFSTYDDLLAAIDTINSDLSRHARAARAIAVEHFDSDRVLTKLIKAIGSPL